MRIIYKKKFEQFNMRCTKNTVHNNMHDVLYMQKYFSLKGGKFFRKVRFSKCPPSVLSYVQEVDVVSSEKQTVQEGPAVYTIDTVVMDAEQGNIPLEVPIKKRPVAPKFGWIRGVLVNAVLYEYK